MPTGPLHNEKKLFSDIAAGDGAAFAVLYDAYSAKLAGYVAHLLNSDLWAEEIVQDVFLKVWANRHALGEVENPSAYLYRMAANRLYDHMKHRALEVKLQYHIHRLAGSERKNFTEDLVDFRITEKLFKEAVSSLPPQRSRVYQLRHEQGLSYEEIARELQISKNTVRNQLVAALEHIRAYLIRHESPMFVNLVLLALICKNIF